MSAEKHKWVLVQRTMYGWDLYRCAACGHEDFPTPFGFMPFWKRCPTASSDPSQTSTAVDVLLAHRAASPSAHSPAVPPDLTASAPARAADVASTTAETT